jgi:hypothetical protein
MYTELPTIEECQAFLKTVNVVLAAFGLPALDKLDFDNAEPMEPTNCLSARNLIKPISPEGKAGSTEFEVSPEIGKQLAEGIGTWIVDDSNDDYHLVDIPDAILRVTDPFDQKIPGLRERLVEAGIVAP